jgi:uncharacterized LabA/DUF88 family protein
MYFESEERTAVFIDGPHLFAISKNNNVDIDYQKLLEFFRQETNVIRAHYYNAIVSTTTHEDTRNPIKPVTDWLDYNGYDVLVKNAHSYTDNSGTRRYKGTNFNVNLTVDALNLSPRMDHAILFVGESDFCSLVDSLKNRGVRVTVISSLNRVSDDLRRKADQFVDISEISDNFSKSRS